MMETLKSTGLASSPWSETREETFAVARKSIAGFVRSPDQVSRLLSSMVKVRTTGGISITTSPSLMS